MSPSPPPKKEDGADDTPKTQCGVCDTRKRRLTKGQSHLDPFNTLKPRPRTPKAIKAAERIIPGYGIFRFRIIRTLAGGRNNVFCIKLGNYKVVRLYTVFI